MGGDDYADITAIGDLYRTTVPLQVNYGMQVLNPLPATTFHGMEVVVSDHVKDDESFIVQGKTIMGRAAFDALKQAALKLGTTAEHAADAMAYMGASMREVADKAIYDTLRGTPLDTNPEQTEMEESPLWGAF
jgi:hypothetical protein